MIKPSADMPWGNHIAFLHIKLPKLTACLSSNPLDFAFGARRTIQRKRNSVAVFLSAKLMRIMNTVRTPEEAARFFSDSIRNSRFAIANLIGPVEKMALANHPVKGLYFSVWCTHVEKGFIDPHKLKSCIEKAFELTFQASVHPNSEPTK